MTHGYSKKAMVLWESVVFNVCGKNKIMYCIELVKEKDEPRENPNLGASKREDCITHVSNV
eukprot:12707482-Ditylum_brightwellii.AAC.1